MTTIKHPIIRADDGTGFMYRHFKVTRNDRERGKEDHYTVWLGQHTLRARTRAAMLALIDAYHVAEKKGWAAIRSGALYCASRCGRGCTHADFLRATEAADKLCKTLGKGWKPRVWESCGWRAAAEKGVAQMHIPNPRCPRGPYSLYFNTVKQIILHGHDAAALVAEAAALARELIAELARDTDLIFRPEPLSIGPAANHSAIGRAAKRAA